MKLPNPNQVSTVDGRIRLGRGVLLAVVLTLSVPGLPTLAQGSRGIPASSQASIRGTVLLPDGAPLTEAVKVVLKVMRGEQSTVFTDQQGRFELRNLAPGDYTVEVEADRNRFELATEKVQIQRNLPTLVNIYLKEKQPEGRGAAGRTISVAMLDQKVPSAARHEFEKASRFASQGRPDDSIEALRRALAIYPNYIMARNDLGAQLMEQGRLDEAKPELEAAVKIDPNAFNAQLNLGILLVRQNKFAEALSALDKALTLEPSAPAGHLYGGIASVELNDTERAEKELKAAYDLGGQPFAVALVHLGRLYLKRGDRELSLKTLQTYLQVSPDGPNAAQVQKLIATLHP
jgi:tetratricopeptide (TPR) repeat protein